MSGLIIDVYLMNEEESLCSLMIPERTIPYATPFTWILFISPAKSISISLIIDQSSILLGA